MVCASLAFGRLRASTNNGVAARLPIQNWPAVLETSTNLLFLTALYKTEKQASIKINKPGPTQIKIYRKDYKCLF